MGQDIGGCSVNAQQRMGKRTDYFQSWNSGTRCVDNSSGVERSYLDHHDSNPALRPRLYKDNGVFMPYWPWVAGLGRTQDLEVFSPWQFGT